MGTSNVFNVYVHRSFVVLLVPPVFYLPAPGEQQQRTTKQASKRLDGLSNDKHDVHSMPILKLDEEENGTIRNQSSSIPS